MAKGVRECVSLVLQDGRTLTCTPEHEVLRADGTWVRADELRPGQDRVVIGLEAPLDSPSADEQGWRLRSASLDLTMSSPNERLRTLAFARLLGHLLNDGSISVHGQARINVGQAIDREVVLNDIEMVTGKRPAGSRYDERKWSIALPKELTEAIVALPGVSSGRKMDHEPRLPDFILESRCPTAVVREFLGGAFGADGHAPSLGRYGNEEGDATIRPPAYSHAVRPEHVAQQRLVMDQIAMLLERCGVDVAGARVYEYPVRRSASSYPAATDGERIEVRLSLPDGLSFVTKVGYRYCVDKALKASAATVYWRTIDAISEQRLRMLARLSQLHTEQPALSFAAARRIATEELSTRETIVFPHYSTLQGNDRFSRATVPITGFRPIHRDNVGFPSPVDLLSEIGAREWFSEARARDQASYAKRYAVAKDALDLPTLTLKVIDRRPAGDRPVYDLSVDELHAFVAAGVAVHNCIGNSGPLATPEVEREVKERDLNVVSVLSGNRNFEGRIHPLVRSSYLASPPLVVAYALAGTVATDLTRDPLGTDRDGRPVFLKDVWPTQDEVNEVMASAITQEMYTTEYGKILEGDRYWKTMPSPTGSMFEWDAASTYVQEPPFFKDLGPAKDVADIIAARVLVKVGDSVTTDHISPAGSFPPSSPAGEYLQSLGVKPVDFNQYGTRRGNHEVLIRGTFANIRLRNQLVQREGWWTRHVPTGAELTIYDAAQRYRAEGTPLIVLAGKEYGSGSSRDWAAKGPLLLGVRAVIAETFERIHRSNLVGMGILPLQYLPGESAASLGLTGEEAFTIRGLATLAPKAVLEVEAKRPSGEVIRFKAVARVDDPVDLDYLRSGGVLPMVFRELLATS
ncbi:MAG TPA: aconitase family protein [Candidatus Limnocylindria bacterium]|nr:aconitase family protein [Candidatus Limnocylindria bacterium]